MLEKSLYESRYLYQSVVAQMVSALGIMIHFTVYSREIKSVGRYENLKFISEALNLHVHKSFHSIAPQKCCITCQIPHPPAGSTIYPMCFEKAF